MLKHWIWFASLSGLNERMKAVLLQRYPDPEEIFYAGKGAFADLEGFTQSMEEALRDKNLTKAEEILAQCQRLRLHILTYGDGTYPRALKNIADPPIVLYYKGQLPDFDSGPVIGVVGTRKASAYGMTAAKRMGYQIAQWGGIVVSGMAAGIDSMAMIGALNAGGTTVGVLGCGADVVYPASNNSLFQDTERYGCILSEFAPGTPPMRQNFPKRNRIISGLSSGVLVVEAPERSGALITARQAVEQGRDVFVVPGNIDQESCAGSNQLLRDGAIMVSSGREVIQEYEGLFPDMGKERTTLPPEKAETHMPKVAQKPQIPKESKKLKKDFKKKGIDKEPSPPYSDLNKELPKLSPEEQAILAALKDGEQLVDDVIAQTGYPASKLLASLTLLELKGRIKRLPGKRIALR